MSLLDRDLQRRILEELEKEYPNSVDFYKHLLFHEQYEEQPFQANLFYLQEHGLITGLLRAGIPDRRGGRIINARITNTGLDFLADDGGLSAILNTVTVRFDVDNVRTIIEDKIIASQLSSEEKESFLKKVRSFSGEMLKDIVLKVFEKGLDRPDLWPVLMKLVS